MGLSAIQGYITNKTPFLEEDVATMQNMVKNKPWFSIGWQILLKAYKQTNDYKYYEILNKVAVQTYDRRHLYRYLQKEVINNLSGLQIEIEGDIETVPEQETTIFQDESLSTFSNTYFSLDDIALDEDIESDDELISKFIKASPKIIPRPVDLPYEEMALDGGENAVIDDMVSESLAEIYISQGLYGMAEECYSKLSLLNPEKSVYFAKLIEGIKNKK